MQAPDPHHTNLILENLAAIVTGSAVVVLGLLRYLGKDSEAKAAINIIKKRPVTHSEVDAKLLKCQLKLTEDINANFNSFREELMTEVRALHSRINDERRKVPRE